MTRRDPIVEAARTLGRARRHGNVCDVLAVLVLAGGVLAAVGIVLDDEVASGFAYVPLGPAVVLFAVLRALALHLHMAVDRVMVEGVED